MSLLPCADIMTAMLRYSDKYTGPVIISLIVALAVTGVFLSGSLERLELLTVDQRYRSLPVSDAAGSPPVAVVALDQNSIKELGRWPIDREHYVRVLDQIYRGGAKAVLLDMDFSSPGPDPEQDEMLARYIEQAGTVVLAAQMDERVTGEGALVRNISLPYPGLLEAAMTLGSITFEVDADGVIRHMPRTIDFIDEIYRPLGAIGAALVDPSLNVPVPGDVLVDFSSIVDPAFPVIPFLKAARGEFEPGLFTSRIVLIGATSSDLHDLWLTPMGVTPGVFIQAAVLDTVLRGSWHARQGIVSTVVGIFLISIFSGLVMAGRSWKGGAIILAFMLTALTATALVTARSGHFIQSVPIFLVFLTMYPVQAAVAARRVDRILAREREKTEAFLSIADLRIAEEEGQESHFVPLVLLGRNLDLSVLHVYTLSKESSDTMIVRRIIGGQEQEVAPGLLEEVLKNGTCLTEHKEGGGTTILVPLITVRQTLGALYAISRRRVDTEDEDVRLLLSFATQTAYFLESLALDHRVKDLYVNTIRAISKALDSKDQYTSAHSELSLDHVEKFGRMCGLDREQIESLHVGALLHDIGKIGVPDNILAKEGNLSGEEYETIRKHPVIGSDIVRGLPFPEDVKMIILHHHERYDGTGYPDGLEGEEIPLLVRIFSIVDVYEALVGSRPYRAPVDVQAALDILREGSGTQFDPELVDIFISCVTQTARFEEA